MLDSIVMGLVMVLRWDNGNGNCEGLDVFRVCFHVSVARLHFSIAGLDVNSWEEFDVSQVVGSDVSETWFNIFHWREQIR